MYQTWVNRKTMWRDGYHATAYELMDVSQDWELDPMCDCTPSQKIWSKTGKWRIEIRKTYIGSRLSFYNDKWHDHFYAEACREPSCTISEISKDDAVMIWLNLETKHFQIKELKALFAEMELEKETEKLIP